jgi:hypothetical protein
MAKKKKETSDKIYLLKTYHWDLDEETGDATAVDNRILAFKNKEDAIDCMNDLNNSVNVDLIEQYKTFMDLVNIELDDVPMSEIEEFFTPDSELLSDILEEFSKIEKENDSNLGIVQELTEIAYEGFELERFSSVIELEVIDFYYSKKYKKEKEIKLQGDVEEALKKYIEKNKKELVIEENPQR